MTCVAACLGCIQCDFLLGFKKSLSSSKCSKFQENSVRPSAAGSGTGGCRRHARRPPPPPLSTRPSAASAPWRRPSERPAMSSVGAARDSIWGGSDDAKAGPRKRVAKKMFVLHRLPTLNK